MSSEFDPVHQGADFERLRLVYGNFPLMLAGSLTAALVLVAVLYRAVASGKLLVWLLVVLSVSLVRLFECRSFRGNPAARSAASWTRRLQFGTAISGLIWGIGGATFLSLVNLAHQMLTVLVFSGVAAAAMTAYGAMWVNYMFFLVPMTVLLEWRLLSVHTRLHYPLAVLNFLFMGVVAYSAFKTDRTLRSVFEVTAENAQLTRALQYQATHDPLVDLVNLREFNTRLANVATNAVTTCEPCALIFIDLDRFKEVNDQGGHAAGDEALRRVSHILKEHIRASDTAARIGGDEFGILLPGCAHERAEQVARDVLAAIHEFVLHWEGGQYFQVGASIGLAYAAAGEADAAALLRVADAACYAAKNAGRGRLVLRRAERLRDPSRFEVEVLRRSV